MLNCFSTESGATASGRDLAKANKKIKDLEHRLTEKEGKVMEITTDLVESMKKNRDVSPHSGFCNSVALCVVPLFAVCVRTLYLCSGII